MYEIATCEWQHFKLINEKFEDWTPLNLPTSYSKPASKFLKK